VAVQSKSTPSAELGLNWRSWSGSFNGRENTLHQLSPYVGKLKTGMAKALINAYSNPGDVVLDPFCGSGVVPFEAALTNRIAWGNDLNPYGFVLTSGKLHAPSKLENALERVYSLVNHVEKNKNSVDLRKIPLWIRKFFHPETLREIYVAFEFAKNNSDYFMLSCLMGILHHQRPGFLSFPSSHLVPYLRNNKFPRKQFPDLYLYRELGPRLEAKVRRAYRNVQLPSRWPQTKYLLLNENAKALSIKNESVDVVISSPPYFGALSYARDNRLRLWFLGFEDWKAVDASLSSKAGTYLSEMSASLEEIHRTLKPGRLCILVLGDVFQNGSTRNTARLISTLARAANNWNFKTLKIFSNKIPDNRRSRRGTTTTKIERILVLKKE
jgi:hypothetical protein